MTQGQTYATILHDILKYIPVQVEKNILASFAD